MGRIGIGLMGVGLLVAGYFLGRSIGPPPLEFPDRGEIRSAAEMEFAVDAALRMPRALPLFYLSLSSGVP